MMMINPSLRADEIKLWLTPTNQSLVIVCTQARLTPDRISFPTMKYAITDSILDILLSEFSGTMAMKVGKNAHHSSPHLVGCFL